MSLAQWKQYYSFHVSAADQASAVPLGRGHDALAISQLLRMQFPRSASDRMYNPPGSSGNIHRRDGSPPAPGSAVPFADQDFCL